MTKILDGIRVLNLAQWFPSGAGGQLGDLGADVIKVERPGIGDAYRGMSTMYGDAMAMPKSGRHAGFEIPNRNQRSITLNLETRRGLDVLYDLAKKSDVFVTNMAERAAREFGIDYATLSALNPRIVYASASAFGPRGPWSERRGFDQTAQARSGLMWAMGDRGWPEPVLVLSALCDQMAATMLTQGILAALLGRERFGIGQEVKVSLLGSMIHLQGVGVGVASLRGRAWSRHSRANTRNPMTNFYKCADGKWILLCEVSSDKYWGEFCEAIGLNIKDDPRFATAMGGRREHNRELIKELDAKFATKTCSEWMQIFEEKGVRFSYSPVLDYYEVLKDAQALANDYVVTFDHPSEGPVKVAGFPVQYGKTPAGINREAPELGQHTEEVLTQICGYSWEKLGELKDAGAI